MNYKIIVATDEKNGIGKENALPWHYSEDLKYFSKMTKSKGLNMNAVIMGRKTYESIGKALPHRVNYVLSRSLKRENVDKNILIFDNFKNLLEDVEKKHFNECWVIGGAEIYRLFLEESRLVNEIFITKIKKDCNCDTFFPDVLDRNNFILDQKWSGISPDLEFTIYKHK